MFEFKKSKYYNGKSLAILVYENDEPYSNLTTNCYPDVDVIKQFKDKYIQFVNVNAIGNDKIIKQLENENKVIKLPDINCRPEGSFVTYPLYKFNKEWVDSLKEES